jgi:hypothetical protein
MAVRIVVVSNISHQVINLLYGETLATGNPSKFPYHQSGELTLAPGSSAEIEEDRLDAGQLEQFKRKGLITSTVH